MKIRRVRVAELTDHALSSIGVMRSLFVLFYVVRVTAV